VEESDAVLLHDKYRWEIWLQGQCPRNGSSDVPTVLSSTELQSYESKSISLGIQGSVSGIPHCLVAFYFSHSLVSLKSRPDDTHTICLFKRVLSLALLGIYVTFL
jgi:hypothetical protein